MEIPDRKAALRVSMSPIRRLRPADNTNTFAFKNYSYAEGFRRFDVSTIQRLLFHYQILTLSDANISDEKGFGFIAHHQAYKEH